MNIGLTFAETQSQMNVNVAPLLHALSKEQRDEKERLLTLNIVMGTLKIHPCLISISMDGIS